MTYDVLAGGGVAPFTKQVMVTAPGPVKVTVPPKTLGWAAGEPGPVNDQSKADAGLAPGLGNEKLKTSPLLTLLAAVAPAGVEAT
jgi:hypothetical protein